MRVGVGIVGRGLEGLRRLGCSPSLGAHRTRLLIAFMLQPLARLISGKLVMLDTLYSASTTRAFYAVTMRCGNPSFFCLGQICVSSFGCLKFAGAKAANLYFPLKALERIETRRVPAPSNFKKDKSSGLGGFMMRMSRRLKSLGCKSSRISLRLCHQHGAHAPTTPCSICQHALFPKNRLRSASSQRAEPDTEVTVTSGACGANRSDSRAVAMVRCMSGSRCH